MIGIPLAFRANLRKIARNHETGQVSLASVPRNATLPDESIKKGLAARRFKIPSGSYRLPPSVDKIFPSRTILQLNVMNSRSTLRSAPRSTCGPAACLQVVSPTAIRRAEGRVITGKLVAAMIALLGIGAGRSEAQSIPTSEHEAIRLAEVKPLRVGIFEQQMPTEPTAEVGGARQPAVGSRSSPKAGKPIRLQPVAYKAQQVVDLPPPAPEPGGQPASSFFSSPAASSEQFLELVVGQGRTVTLKKEISTEKAVGVIAVGDPSVADFEVLPNPRFLRVIGKRVGVTDLTIVTADDEVLTIELRVVYDLAVIRAQISQTFPGSQVDITQLRESLLLEGQVRSNAQAARIEEMVAFWLASNQPDTQSSSGSLGGQANAVADTPSDFADEEGQQNEDPLRQLAGFESGSRSNTRVRVKVGQIINLLRVPGSQQVLLQVRVAELNRTGLREIGADWLFASDSGNVMGTNIAGSTVGATATGGPGGLFGEATSILGPNSTAFGIFPTANLSIMLRALRRNSLLSVLAEPNLVAMSGHEANFLAGGQFPVPVQSGIAGQTSIQFKDFGVQLRFVPTIIDEETIRLLVAPEVSTIDESLGTTLVPGGIPTPGINTRRVQTTVEMRQGETLALAGLLTVSIEAQTARIPGLGDLPYLGPLFSNTSHERQEKELLVLVTPYLIAAVPETEDLPLPGQCIAEPNDLEFYFLNRIEGRTGRPFDSTMSWEDPFDLVRKLELESKCIHGPVGFSQ